MALTSYPIFGEVLVYDVISPVDITYGPIDNSASCGGLFFRVEALGPGSLITGVTCNGAPVSFPAGARAVYGSGSPSATFTIAVSATISGSISKVRLTVWAMNAKGYYNPAEWPRVTHPAGT